ncbi:histone-lysine n- h3 lysine-79 specific-like isoform x3 protein [Lasius niger]|uniref:Histone-lysine n-h3 lysine-79 specific-like isoform x3 protein n=2 Tax=Lasius TaxID=488720 RepID=A0A0J7L7P4_LASNI|nr:histone-lysine n- h3 lysine-79 specific-like isoform x3 protein [Lasius niger]
MPHFIVDTHLETRDEHPEVPEDHVPEDHVPEDHVPEDHVPEDHVPGKPPSPLTDFTKSCCYLCAQNTLAIATASAKPEQSDKCVQVSAHKFHAETSPTLDKSCSPTLLLVRTVQSSVKVRTRETSTLCPGTSMVRRGETEPRSKKRKKFSVFLGLTRTKCPAGRQACETDKPAAAGRDNNAEKREPRNEKCCREKNA